MSNFATPTRHFSDKPSFEYRCPICKVGSLIPDLDSFKSVEPKHSKSAHSLDEWEPEWVEYRFSVECICTKKSCQEIAFVTGTGRVSDQYDYRGDIDYYDSFTIKSFVPAPPLIAIPDKVPKSVSEIIERSFALFWCDVAAAANALRASLEALLTELKVPAEQQNKHGKTVEINLHARLEIWAKSQKDYSELCMALKEVGNLGSHGETVNEKLFADVLKIYEHVLRELYENDSAKIKALASKVRAEAKQKKAKAT